MPIDCLPFGCVAEINGMIHVGWLDRMFQLKEGAWKGEKHRLGILIGSVFECEGKGYVMEGGGFHGECKRIYEWKSETRDLELLTEIPHEYQLKNRSAFGHNGNIYLVGGKWGSDRVDCFDINKGEWEPIKKMKNERFCCSLAVIDDKMFVGGMGAENSVECFLMKEQKWIDINPTTKYHCQLSSWNGKLVATGGGGLFERSNCVELYDELSGDWLPLPSMNEGRRLHGACETKDNQLVVVGGWGAENSLECLKL